MRSQVGYDKEFEFYPQNRDQLRIVDRECHVVIFTLRNFSKIV